MSFLEKLGRRERQIVEAVYRLGSASVNEVRAALTDPPTYSAVRAFLRILEEKGYLTHTQDGAKYIYHPATPRPTGAREALTKLVETFFGGRPEQVVAALLTDDERKLTDDELEQLSQLIAEARQKGPE